MNGDERLHPLRCGFPVCDTVGGLNAAFAILAALYHRERTGEGQFIDVALLDSIMPLMGWVAANLLIGGQPPVPMGNDNFTAAPSGTFATRDGHINIAANKQEQWEAVARRPRRPGAEERPAVRGADARKQNRKALTPLLEEKLGTRSTAEWVAALNAARRSLRRDPRARRRPSRSRRSGTGRRCRTSRSRGSAPCRSSA